MQAYASNKNVKFLVGYSHTHLRKLPCHFMVQSLNDHLAIKLTKTFHSVHDTDDTILT